MININKYPAPNRILLDANNTLVSITSSNGLGFYFRAIIYIDNEIFDEQSWSRRDDYTAEKDLKKLYYAYFETVFNADFVSGLQQQLHLIKKLSITIKEYSIGTDQLIQTQNLPDLYLMYNVNPVAFNDALKIQFLAVNPEVLQVPPDGKISIPFMVNAENESLLLELKDNIGNVLDSKVKASFTEKRVYQYNFDLSQANLTPSTLYLSLAITVGTTTVLKNIRLFKKSNYPIKEITFLNNFGYWCYAYLDGQLTIEDNFDTKTYEENDGFESVYEINEKQTFTINTGSLLSSEKAIINQICKALEAKIYLNYEYIKLINATKKITSYKDRDNLYAENLTFSVKQNSSIENSIYAVEDYDSNDYDSNDYNT